MTSVLVHKSAEASCNVCGGAEGGDSPDALPRVLKDQIDSTSELNLEFKEEKEHFPASSRDCLLSRSTSLKFNHKPIGRK